MTAPFLTSLTHRITAIVAPLMVLATVTSAQALNQVNPGWIQSVNGKSAPMPVFPGADAYSFLSFPSITIESPGVTDPLVGRDSRLSLALFSPNPSLTVGVVDRFDPSRVTTGALAGNDQRWSSEPGLFAEYWTPTQSLRVRGELRFGAPGSTGMTGDLGADFIQRVGKFVISFGPHMSIKGADYAEAQYGAASSQTLNAIGERSFGAAGLVRFAAGKDWSTSVYANYDRVLTAPGDPSTPRNSIGLGAGDEVRIGASFNYLLPSAAR